MESPFAPISESCAKALGDKMYDKRKLASVEIEKTAVELNNKQNTTQIRKLIDVLANDFATSRDPNRRKGGLIGLAATSLGLGKDCEKYINELVTPILNCLSDPDLRVRFFACESLYNVVKVARGAIIPLFPEIFSALTKLVTDPDQSVKDGSELLDRLLKDIVTESSDYFDLNSFIPLLRERIYLKNSFARQYVISWISVLNAVPGINMVLYLTDILDGLFLMLEDNMIEIHRMCETLMAQFLKTIRNDPSSVNMEHTINTLIGHAQSTNDLVQSTAINWIREFVQLAGSDMLPFASGIFTAILPCLAYEGESRKRTFAIIDEECFHEYSFYIRECAEAVNKNLLELISSKDNNKTKNIEKLDLSSIMEVLRQYLSHNSVHTKVAVLKWIHHLFNEIQDEMSVHATSLFPVLLGILSDNSDEVVLQGLVVLAEIVNTKHSNEEDFNKLHYRKFLLSLLSLFSEDKQFLENRGSLIVRELCVLLNAEYVYRTFAEILLEETTNIKFASTMVRLLNMILLTSSELFELRSALRTISNRKSAELFKYLYKSWAFCPVSTLCLCLLTQCYQHVSDLVLLFGDIEITVDILTELDKLVQLIESPIFASLRLKLVSPGNNCADSQHLAHALFGLLMLLPQTESFSLLKNRLQCVPSYWGNLPPSGRVVMEAYKDIDFNELIVHFKKIQETHRIQKMAHRKRNVLLWDSEVYKDK